MQTKPSSKIIQISTIQCPDGIPVLFALCEDGSIWGFVRTEWTCLLEAPIQPKNDLPAVGSRWRGKISERPIEIVEIPINPKISYRLEDCSINTLSKEMFLENYEPIPNNKESDAK